MYDIAFGVYTLRSLVSLAGLHLLDFIISCTRTWSRKTIPLSLSPLILKQVKVDTIRAR